jgi:hypothetical protein
LGLALGGRPAAAFAERLMVPVSNDTLLRVVRRWAEQPRDKLSIIGIDDFAFRRFATSAPSTTMSDCIAESRQFQSFTYVSVFTPGFRRLLRCISCIVGLKRSPLWRSAIRSISLLRSCLPIV